MSCNTAFTFRDKTPYQEAGCLSHPDAACSQIPATCKSDYPICRQYISLSDEGQGTNLYHPKERTWHIVTNRFVVGKSSYWIRIRMFRVEKRRNLPMAKTTVMYNPMMPKEDRVCPISPPCTLSSTATILRGRIAICTHTNGQRLNSVAGLQELQADLSRAKA